MVTDFVPDPNRNNNPEDEFIFGEDKAGGDLLNHS
jgi:hypothetical protein